MPTDVSHEDGNSIIINRLKFLNRWKQVKTIQQQDAALKSFLRNPANRNFRPGKMVMLAIDSDSKKLEKSYDLKVTIRYFFFLNYHEFVFTYREVVMYVAHKATTTYIRITTVHYVAI